MFCKIYLFSLLKWLEVNWINFFRPTAKNYLTVINTDYSFLVHEQLKNKLNEKEQFLRTHLVIIIILAALNALFFIIIFFILYLAKKGKNQSGKRLF